MKNILKHAQHKAEQYLKRLSFRTGLLTLLLCLPFYILSFAQLSWNLTYAIKGTLWVIFFGLAKTFQYLGLAILGVDGIKRIKKWWIGLRNKGLTNM